MLIIYSVRVEGVYMYSRLSSAFSAVGRFWSFSNTSATAISALLCTSIVAGCAAIGARVDTPEPEQIIVYVSAFEKHFSKKIDTGQDYVIAGYTYVDHYCELFFTELEIEKRKLLFTKNTTQQLLATTVPALINATKDAATNVSKPLAVLSAVAGLTNFTFEQYQSQFIFAPYGTQLRLKVHEAQHTFKTSLQADTTGWQQLSGGLKSSVTIAFLAHQVVQQYAQLCTIPQLDLYIVTALDSTRAEKSKTEPLYLKCATECDPLIGKPGEFNSCLQTCVKRELAKQAQEKKVTIVATPARPVQFRNGQRVQNTQQPAVFSISPIISRPK